MEGGSEYVIKLNGYAQLHGLDPPEYKVVDSSGPAHLKIFKLSVHFAGRVFPEGIGNSKKEAKQNAAKNAWEILSSSKSNENPSDSHDVAAINLLTKVSEYCQQNKLSHNYTEVKREGPSHNLTFHYKLVIGEKEYPVVQGKSVREAKQKAAQLAWTDLHEQLSLGSKESGDSVLKGQIAEATPSKLTSQSLQETNFISKINEYCQQNKYSLNYYDPIFVYKLQINKKEYPAAQGKSVKEAKQNAAQLAWSMLQEQMSLDSKESGESVSEEQISEATPSTHTSQSLEESDFISKITNYCHQNNYSHSYLQVKKEGPSHNPLFFYKLIIDKEEYPVVEGKSVREAKQKAAQLAWSVLKEQGSQNRKSFDGSHKQSSSGSSWIKFEDSSKSSSQISSNTSDAEMEEKSQSDLRTTSTNSKIRSQYDSFENLGHGSYGHVYKARNIDMDIYFAIKEIQPEEPKKSLQEAKVLAGLLHPNIVRYYTSWFENTGFKCSNVKVNSKFLFIEMEFCDGGTLRCWIQGKNKESLEIPHRRKESLKIALQILSGVDYIHSKRLIHRDLKPENILFGQDGNVRIGDFGLVTQDNDEGEIVERTGDRGTPNYMAPEQVGVSYDRKVDIFALGLIFFELLWRLATGHERAAIWADVRCQNLPKEFIGTFTLESHIIKTMLSDNPEARPEASALKTEIEKLNPDGNTEQGNQTI